MLLAVAHSWEFLELCPSWSTNTALAEYKLGVCGVFPCLWVPQKETECVDCFKWGWGAGSGLCIATDKHWAGLSSHREFTFAFLCLLSEFFQPQLVYSHKSCSHPWLCPSLLHYSLGFLSAFPLCQLPPSPSDHRAAATMSEFSPRLLPCSPLTGTSLMSAATLS